MSLYKRPESEVWWVSISHPDHPRIRLIRRQRKEETEMNDYDMGDNTRLVDPDEVALSSIYLALGFEDAHKRDDAPTKAYDAWESVGGQLEIMSELTQYAKFLEQWLLDERKTDYPGVFSYEFVEPLGSWLYANGPCAMEDFDVELIRRWAEWMKENNIEEV